MLIPIFNETHSVRYANNRYVDWRGNQKSIIHKLYVCRESDGTTYATFSGTRISFCISQDELDDTRETKSEAEKAPLRFMHWSQEKKMKGRELPELRCLLSV